MTIFHSLHGPCPPIPDDLTCAQFILDTHLPQRTLRNGDSPWLIEDASGRTIGYEELRTRTYGLANSLRMRWGIGEDDVVCVFSTNHVDYPVALWASHRLGAIVTCANPSYTSEELVHQLRTANATVIIAHPNSLDTALDAARQCGIPTDHIIVIEKVTSPTQSNSASAIPYVTIQNLIDEGLSRPQAFTERRLNPGEGRTKLAFLSFSSGTTGKPKAVAIPHYAVMANCIQMSAHQRLNNDHEIPWEKRKFRAGDVAAAALPFYHIYGLVVNMHWMLFAGLSIVVIPKFNFVEFLKSIERHKITHLLVVPPQIVLFCKHEATKKYDLSTVRFVSSGAAPLSAELTQQLCKILPSASIGQGYGMTETCTTVSMIPVNMHIGTYGSAGQLIPGCSAKVLKEDGTFAGYDEEGELIITGPNMALRYTNDEKATKETFLDGWVRTGDEVKISKNGDIFVLDRLKEIMKVRGFQVAPAELEGHLLNHPDVADVCVVGIPDDYSGEVPMAYVVLEPRAAERAQKIPEEANKIKASIAKHVSDAKVQYKWLKGGVEFTDAIPKNPSGKLLRRLLRDQAKALVAQRKAKAKL